MKTKQPLLIVTLIALILLGFLLPTTGLPTAHGNATIPTITPPPTATQPGSGGGSGGGTNPTSVPPTSVPPTAVPPTNTPIPPTATNIPTAVPTNADGFLPTAVPCDPRPNVRAINLLNMRPGPDTAYGAPVDQLAANEVAWIIGRAEFAQWWQIETSDGVIGWVPNNLVAVYGRTDEVPIIDVDPLLIGGATATPGPTWQPTPNPTCPTATPTASASPIPATAIATATVATPTNTPAPATTATNDEANAEAVANADAAINDANANDTGTISAETTSTTTASGEDTTAPSEITGDPIPTAVPLETDASNTNATNILPIAAAILIIGGIGLFIYQRTIS